MGQCSDCALDGVFLLLYLFGLPLWAGCREFGDSFEGLLVVERGLGGISLTGVGFGGFP